MRRASLAPIWLVVVLAATSVSAASSTKVYVDTKGIDARTDLTATQKAEIKTAMKNTIKSNLEQAFGVGNVTVTDDSSQAASADRTVKTSNTVGSDKDEDGNPTYQWGDWTEGSSNTNVYVGTFVDDPPGVTGRLKNSDGSWDTTKLGTAMGTVAAHELAHSYSAGHDDTDVNKMSTSNSASELGGGLHFRDPAKKTLQENSGKPPCSTSTDYSTTACIADWWSDPTFPPDFLLHERLSVNTSFSFGGPLAGSFDFGWWGIDTDNGAIDGNSWGDFVYKSSMSGTPEDADKITFFDGWTAHFVLRGKVGTPYDGQYFDVMPPSIMLSNPVIRPDGTSVARHIDLLWDVDGALGPDVVVAMDTNCYGPGSPVFSGFRLGIAPPVSIAEAKLRPDGAMVSLIGTVVTAAFPGCIYIEEPTRASGVRCTWSGATFVGHAVRVIGKIGTNVSGEREIEANEVSGLGPLELGPLGMIAKAVGGGDFEYTLGLWPSGQQGVMGGVGLNSIGLFVRVAGKVIAIEPEPQPTWFRISDGSGGLLKVLYGPDPVYPGLLDNVIVDGVVTCEREGGPSDPPTRALRATAWR